jgi:hypothetical protein
MRQRQSVRLGKHGDEYIFKRVQGLHDDVTGIAVVVGGDPDDPEILFKEHGTGERCEYFMLLGEDVQLNEKLGPKNGRPEIAERVTSEDWPTKLHALQAAFALENAANVNQMMATMTKDLVPDGGGVFLIRTSARLQRRKAIIRVQHAAQAQPDRPLDDLLGEPQPLEEHAAGGDGLHHHLYTPLVLLASPYIRGFTASRIIAETGETYTLVVLNAPGHSAPYDRDEITWLRVLHDGLARLRKLELADIDWIAEINAPAADIPAKALVEWWTAQLNALFTEATDLGRYRADDGVLDARNAFRELRTLDRILGNCVRIQANAEDHVGRSSAAFEFFDLFPNLLPQVVDAKRIWAALADPKLALNTLVGAFANAPEPIKSVLTTRATEVTSKLRDETIKTVVPGRFVKGAVQVGHQRKPINQDPYAAKVLHQLRNTHHGYELQEQAQRDLLDTHTGHISVAFPELVVLYVLAIVADPASALDGRWI